MRLRQLSADNLDQSALRTSSSALHLAECCRRLFEKECNEAHGTVVVDRFQRERISHSSPALQRHTYVSRLRRDNSNKTRPAAYSATCLAEHFVSGLFVSSKLTRSTDGCHTNVMIRCIPIQTGIGI